MRKGWTGAFVAALLTVAALPVQAQHIESRLNLPPAQLCVQPEGGSGADGAAVVMVPCRGEVAAQFWAPRFVRNDHTTGRDVYWMQNQENGKCLDLGDGRRAEGAPLQQRECSASTTTWWSFRDQAAPNHVYFKMASLRSDTCADVRGGSTDGGAARRDSNCAEVPGRAPKPRPAVVLPAFCDP